MEQEEEECFLIRNLDTNETWSLEEFLEIEDGSFTMVRRRSFQKTRKESQQENFLIRNLDTNESWSLEEFLEIDKGHLLPTQQFIKRKRTGSTSTHHYRIKKRQIFSALTLLLLGLGGLFVITSQWHKLGQFLEWMASIGIWGNVLFVLIFLVVGFPFMLGYIPLAVGAGYLYGMVEGTITISIGATVGCSVAFWMCRTLTYDWMKSKLSKNPKWNIFMLEVKKNAWKITLLVRLLPFPFGLVNGLFALSSISFHVFIIGSFIGLLPFQLMWTYLGTTLRSITEAVNGEMEFGLLQQLVLLVQVALAIGLAIYLIYLGKNSMMAETETQPAGGNGGIDQGDVESVSVVTVQTEEPKPSRTNLLSSLPNLLLGPRARFSKRPHSPIRSKVPVKRNAEWV